MCLGVLPARASEGAACGLHVVPSYWLWYPSHDGGQQQSAVVCRQCEARGRAEPIGDRAGPEMGCNQQLMHILSMPPVNVVSAHSLKGFIVLALSCEQDEGEEGDVLEGLRRAASAAAAAEFLQAHGHRLLTPEATASEVLRELQAAAEVRACRCPVLFVKAKSHCVCCCAPVHSFSHVDARHACSTRSWPTAGLGNPSRHAPSPAQVSEAKVEAARAAMAQAAAAMRDICKSGNVLLLPALPGPPPPRPRGRAGASDAEAAWERGALQLSALAALAGVPQVHLRVKVTGWFLYLG